MFERYNEKARRAIFFARYEASVLGSPYIEAEHLLLGLMREDEHLFAALLGPLNNTITLAEEFRTNVPKQAPISTSVDLPIGHAVKRCFAYAAEEAEGLKHKEITPDHLLLGLLREDSRASEFLVSCGVTLISAREKITNLQITTSKSAEAIADLSSEFARSLQRLTPEIEPATVFSLAPSPKGSHS